MLVLINDGEDVKGHVAISFDEESFRSDDFNVSRREWIILYIFKQTPVISLYKISSPQLETVLIIRIFSKNALSLFSSSFRRVQLK